MQDLMNPLAQWLEPLAAILEPSVLALQIVAYGGLTLVATVAVVGGWLEDRARGP
ncbi:hypothetical protein Atoyac15_18 [Aeromonas phage Atoyac15]|uniref:Uncharacterized protein n=1 Tax=Aeromonas phage Atoyac15 TaxID=2767551 RepID=A0A866D2V6_9CAUD|nr:hypothetical protein Atoyac15_18 [Aeromonas phage Atoyac15]